MKPFAPLILVAFVLAADCTTVFAKSRESTAKSRLTHAQSNSLRGAFHYDRRLGRHKYCKRDREGCGLYGCDHLWQSAEVC